MIVYGAVWHPESDNLGDDLQALAARALLPRVDTVLDGSRLDQIDGVDGDARIVALLSGNVYRRADHWPPDPRLAPVCVGLHFSAENAWGVPLTRLDGAGLQFLREWSPIGCRDESTLALMQQLSLPCDLTGCLTLTLPRPEVEPAAPYICCVDAPEEIVRLLKPMAAAEGIEVRAMTHQRRGEPGSYERRMEAAQMIVDAYAGAKFVITRRLHCAMACLAVGTPVLLIYNEYYEDITRFAPMDGMVRAMSSDAFAAQLRQEGFPRPWKNPPEAAAWRDKLIARVQQGLIRAETAPMYNPSPEAAAAWRAAAVEDMIGYSVGKLRRLEQEQVERLHDKFSLLLHEDGVRTVLEDVLEEKTVQRALDRVSRRRELRRLPLIRRPAAWWRLVRARTASPLTHRVREEVASLGWPDHEEYERLGE